MKLNSRHPHGDVKCAHNLLLCYDSKYTLTLTISIQIMSKLCLHLEFAHCIICTMVKREAADCVHRAFDKMQCGTFFGIPCCEMM